MFRCNLQDLGSVISGDLEVPIFKNLRIRKAFNLFPHFKYCFAAHAPAASRPSPRPKNSRHFYVQASVLNDVIKSALLMCFAPLPFSRAGAPV